MYFFYFDESGSRDPSIGTPEAPRDHLYVLLAVGMFERQWSTFDREIGLLKLELADHVRRLGKGHFDLADCEVKSNWIGEGMMSGWAMPYRAHRGHPTPTD